MAKYRLYKTDNYTRINAFLEDRSEGGQNITFMPVLRSEYANYVPVELLVPAELNPRTYQGQYGHTWFVMDAPVGCAFLRPEPALRLPMETVGGRDYAFCDFRALDERDEYTGWTYRVRMAFERC